MKKICFITTTPVTLKAFVLKTAMYLHQNGDYDITFISSYDEGFKKMLPDYIHYNPIEMKRGVSFDGIKVISKLKKDFKVNKYDIIQYSTPNAALYASIAGKLASIQNRLYCQWGIRYVGFNGIKRIVFKAIEKTICNNSTWIEPDSFGNLNFSIKEGLYKNNKSSVIWNGSANGVDLEKFNLEKKSILRNETRKKLKVNQSIIIGFVGRLERDKGINELLLAFKEIEKKHDVKLLIVGQIDKPKYLDKQLWEWAINNKNIILTGRKNDTEKYYAAMDIFALPSYREGFGTVVIEAEAMGVPVVVTNIPGPTDAMIDGKTGIVVEVKNYQSLKKGIETLILDNNLRLEMSNNSTKFVESSFSDKELFKYILKDRDLMISKGKKSNGKQ